MLDLIIANRELIKLIYGIILLIIFIVIVVKTHRLFHISLHQGIRYFRNAFFFYGVAFAMRYLFRALSFYRDWIYPVSNFLFEYFIIMAGFFLMYSLMWKKIDGSNQAQISSLFNKKLIIFYVMALIITVLDNIWNTYFFMFLSQIILFSSLSVISYANYIYRGERAKFLKFYFIAMVLSLFAWGLNAVAAYLDWNTALLISVPFINLIIFLLFLYGVVNLTKKD